MKTGVLILAILGSVLALALGACSGACLSGLGDMAKDGGEGTEKGAQLLMMAILQAVLGIVVGVMSYNKMSKGVKTSLFEKLGLFVAGAFSITNTFVFITGGACHIIAGILVCIYKPTNSKEETK